MINFKVFALAGALVACSQGAFAQEVDLSGIVISQEKGITKPQTAEQNMQVGVRIVNNLDVSLSVVAFQCVAMDQDNAIGTASGMVMNVKSHGTFFDTANMDKMEKAPSRIDCRISAATTQ